MSSGYDRLGANVPGKVIRDFILTEEGKKAYDDLPAAYKKFKDAGGFTGIAPDLIDVQSPLTPRQMGYTGNTCSSCQSTRMQIAGHCEVCLDCGTTTGCS